jgi:hypothetical protein
MGASLLAEVVHVFEEGKVGVRRQLLHAPRARQRPPVPATQRADDRPRGARGADPTCRSRSTVKTLTLSHASARPTVRFTAASSAPRSRTFGPARPPRGGRAAAGARGGGAGRGGCSGNGSKGIGRPGRRGLRGRRRG